ncbi:hypothetical protein CLCAR_0793 [Clostridium carboxidivorans P7]|nr:hypothetical protein CLCAR_0793 [Clostridium carboxidivorans P7]
MAEFILIVIGYHLSLIINIDIHLYSFFQCIIFTVKIIFTTLINIVKINIY